MPKHAGAGGASFFTQEQGIVPESGTRAEEVAPSAADGSTGVVPWTAEKNPAERPGDKREIRLGAV